MVLKTVKSAIIILGIFIQCTFGSVISSKVTSQSDAIGILAQGKIQEIQVTNQIMDADNESSLYHTLTNLTNNTLVNITTKMTLFSTVQLRNFENISIIGHNKPTVECANIGGMLLFISSYNCRIEGIIWKNCGYMSNMTYPWPVLGFYKSAKITMQDCFFIHSMGQSIVLSEVLEDIKITNCKFEYNHNRIYKGHGAAVHYNKGKDFYLKLAINNCKFAHYYSVQSVVYIGKSIKNANANFSIHNSTFIHNQGTSIYFLNLILVIGGNTIFENNVGKYGGAVFVNINSNIIFDENSNIFFNNNAAKINGGALFLRKKSLVIFKSTSVVQFVGNQANRSGGAMFFRNASKIIFQGNSQVTFKNNRAIYKNGAAVFANAKLHIEFKGNCKVLFSKNIASGDGGAIALKQNSSITFEGRSSVSFINNIAQTYGGAISLSKNSHIIFQHNCTVRFQYNKAVQGAGIFSMIYSSITLQENAVAIFNANQAILNNNDLSPLHSADGMPNENFAATENTANSAAMHLAHHCNITIEDKSLATFSYNKGTYGGAVNMYDNSHFIIKENTTVAFDNNEAKFGGAVYVNNNSSMLIAGKSVLFITNTATQDGGALYFHNFSHIAFEAQAMVTFAFDKAARNGGVGYFTTNSSITFDDNTRVRFDKNEAVQQAGAIYASGIYVAFRGNSTAILSKNKAKSSGGALYFTNNSDIVFSETSKVTFDNNEALHGGAVYSNNNTNVNFKDNSTVFFNQNIAIVNGGAINALSNSNIILTHNTTVTFTNNSAQYGGAILFDSSQGSLVFNTTEKDMINFINNNAKISGHSVYLEVNKSCDSSCLTNRIVGIHINTIPFIATPPSKLKLYDPAKCIDDDNDTNCDTYYLPNIMLGQEIVIPACVLDYYNQKPIDTTQFLIHGESNLNYFTRGPNEVLISCDTFQGINVIGNESLSRSMNFSITITLNVDHNSDWKLISVILTVELSPCHPGFQYTKESQACECYSDGNIVLCSGTTSSIKRGYWFGSVTGRPTVTSCPINYCNFSCCDTANGFYHLSPLRDNQCKSHRHGVACGSCIEGYTLSFDSTDCVQVDKCTAGHTILIVTITLIYWIALVTIVFVMMHYKVRIGYLYSITFYYSIVDILLSQNLYISQALFMTVNIMSSTAKITPQFLGQLCLAKDLSAIDQQFIHYIHPLAVSFILIIISFSARCSYRLSAFISGEIIPVICFLLLLSYTSVATTSLLLMRTLTFLDVDKVYTYLSPDIEYFHGRHLAYGVIAILFIIAIVLGLPLLLSLEPFLNAKINFTRIKPLLDQFQGCYKDKYRCFAGYYMICRLAIIIIIINNSSYDFTGQYLLTAVCAIITLLHLTVRPYADNTLNILDGIILQLIVLVTVLPLFDTYNSNPVLGITLILVILPVLLFLMIELVTHKGPIKNFITHCKFNFNTNNSTDIPASNSGDNGANNEANAPKYGK